MRSWNKKSCTIMALLIGSVFSFFLAPANATTYDWTLSGAVSGAGTITTNDALVSNAGSVGTDIIGITGAIDNETVSGLNGFGDNILYPSNLGSDGFGPLKGLLDALGLSFSLGGSTTNIFFAGTAGYDFESFGNSDPNLSFARNESFTIEAVATPLPATLPLFAGGLGVVGYLTRRRKRRSKQTLAVA
jgi:hypothetical protein